MSKPILLETIAALRAWRSEQRKAGKSVGLAPTMGALHAGHLSLIPPLRAQVNTVLFSIFVNPTQFAAGEDFSRYPRPFSEDVSQLAAQGVEAVFAPAYDEIYPVGYATEVSLRGPAQAGLEDAFRPTHFAGVATVVTKLFMQSAPDVAIFGEKDYQQLVVIKRLVRDLDMPVRILAGATSRARDGLALSSRNVYLSAEEREIAPALYATINDVAAELQSGRRDYAALESRGSDKLTALGFVVDYLAICDRESLEHPKVDALVEDLRILVAAKLGKTRLIDNIAAG